MLNIAKENETYERYSIKINSKQLVIAGCIEQLDGSESIDKSLEDKLRQCVDKRFNAPYYVQSRFNEMFPDIHITESKL